MPACPLTLREREEIRAGIERNDPDTKIARDLGRHRTTINREINRNGGRANYSATNANQRARTNRHRPKVPRLVADPDLAATIDKRLKQLDSPMRISIELAAQGISISHETIYTSIYQPHRGLDHRLGACLHLKRRRRKHRHQHQPNFNSLGTYNPIHTRPAHANDRTTVGHLEGDLIVGAYNRSALITVFDRATRHLWLASVNAKTAAAATDSIIATLHRIPPSLRHTLTWDQGAEIAHHQHIAATTGITIYIADPKSPWQRPTNEAGNALVRRYVGKGTDLSAITQPQLRWIEHRINTIPRRTLNWNTAHHAYAQAVAMTT